jgi:hypothetical protein
MMTRSKRKTIIFILIPVLILIAIAAAFPFASRALQKQEYLKDLQSLSFNKYLGEPAGYSSTRQFPHWDAYIFEAPEFQCVTGGPYVILAHRGEEADKTVLWFDVGAECWPGHAQCGGRLESNFAAEETLQYLVDGVDMSSFGPTSADKLNPMTKWNYVYLPTCDASSHFGDAAADFDEDGTADHWFNGLRQTSAAVNIARELFPESRKILVAGSSNGGYATFGAAPITRLAFPEARLYVLNDSGPGIFSPDRPDVYPVIQNAWNLAPMFPADCEKCTQQLAYLADWMLARDANLKIGLFTSYKDAIVSEVFGMEPEENRRLMLEVTGEIHERHPQNYKRFLVKGDSHTIVDYYQKVDGVRLWDWIAELVNDDPAWSEHLQKE